MHNLQSLKKSFRSYEKAIQKFAERGFSDLNLHGSGYSYDIRREWDSYSPITGIGQADDCFIKVGDLFDYGRPKIIEKQTWLYKDSYFEVSFESHEQFSTFYFDGFKKGIQEDKHTMTVYWYKVGIGLGNWKTKIKELNLLCDKCKPTVKEKLSKVINDADKKYNEWQESLNKALTSSLL